MKASPHLIIPRRARQRGAAVFIVVMAILLLSSLGLFALYSAGVTVRAAGYQRLSAQTLYTAELGVMSGTAYLSVPGYADANYKRALADDANGVEDQCDSVPAGTFCKRILMGDIDSTIQEMSSLNILELTAAEGSMGPYPAGDPSAIEGDFILEMTDPRRVDVPGSEAGSTQYQRVTLTSYGIVRPEVASGEVCTGATGQNLLATRRGMRAHAVIGPIQ